MQNKSTGKTVLIVLLLLVTIASLILATFAWARYTTIETGSASATVAKWDVTFDNSTTRITKTFSHVVDGKLAPGTDGSITMAIASPSTETAYEFTIDITKLQNKPTNLHFYTDAEFTEEIDLSTGTAFKGFVPLQDNVADFQNAKMGEGVLTTNDSSVKQPVIYWRWLYQTDDETILADLDSIPADSQARVLHDLKVVAKEKGATVVEPDPEHLVTGDTIATLVGKLQALTNESVRVLTDKDIAKVINDAIDTSEALNPKTMSFDVEFEAVQYTPGADVPTYAQ